jgi:hypothetical protein
MLRLLFESVVQRCIAQSLISADGFCGRRQPDRGGRQRAAIGTKPRMEALDVEPQQVVLGLGESADWRF